MLIKAGKIGTIEATTQVANAISRRNTYAWKAFALDYGEEAEGTNRFDNFLQLDEKKQAYIVAFSMWVLCQKPDGLEEVIGKALELLKQKEYRHIHLWVFGDTQPHELQIADVVDFFKSISYSDLLELTELTESVFGVLQNYDQWVDIVLINKHPSFIVKKEFSMSVRPAVCYHEPVDYQLARKENWFS